MTYSLDDKFETLRELVLLLAISKPWAVELERTGTRSIIVRSHRENIGHIIGAKGAHVRSLQLVAQNTGFLLSVQDKPDADAYTHYSGSLVAQDVLERLLEYMCGQPVMAESQIIDRMPKYVCPVPRAIFTSDLQKALDTLFYAAGFVTGDGAGVVLLPE